MCSNKPSILCVDEIKIVYKDQSWILKQGGEVTDDLNSPIKLPFEASIINIKESGDNIVAVLDNGVKVLWNKIRNVEIEVPDTFMRKTDGMYMQ